MKSKYFFIGTASMLIASCGMNNTKKESNTHSEAQIQQLVSEGKTSEAADKYARIGELLIIPEGVQYADEMFDRALELDSSNLKANFYSAFTKILVTSKGLATRLEPIATNAETEQLIKFKEDVEKQGLPELTQLIFNVAQGKEKFKTYRDHQLFLKNELGPTVVSSAEKLQKITSKGQKFGISIDLNRLGLSFLDSPDYSETSSCSRVESGWSCTEKIEYNSQMFPTPARLVVDEGDLKVLHGSMLGWVTQIQIATAYNASGLEQVRKKIEALGKLRTRRGQQMSDREIVDIIKEQNDLGLLENNHELGQISKNLGEALRHVLDLREMHDVLCETTGNAKRRANLIFPICVEWELVSQSEAMIEMLAGATNIELGRTSHGDPIHIFVDVTKVLRNPPRDLKTALPEKFDGNGRATEAKDPTFGGVFPDGDLTRKLRFLGGSRNVHIRRGR